MHSVAATSSARTHRRCAGGKSEAKPTRHRNYQRADMRVLAIALCALQAFSFFSSERDEHGMRQALRLARMRAPRASAARARAGRKAGRRNEGFYGGARPHAGSGPVQSTSSRSCPPSRRGTTSCTAAAEGHRTSRLMRSTCTRSRVRRHVVASRLGRLRRHARREPFFSAFSATGTN